MVDIYIDPATNDIGFANNTMRITQSQGELTRQKIQIWLALYRGEWFANVVAGIPYLKNDFNPVQLLGQPDKSLFDLYIREGILSREGVKSLDRYESIFDKAQRTLSVSFTFTVTEGEVVSVENFPITA